MHSILQKSVLILTLLSVPDLVYAWSFDVKTSSGASSAGKENSRIEFGGQMFLRARGKRADQGEMNFDYGIQRARLNLVLIYNEHLKLNIEPDFGGADADFADVFIELTPIKDLDFRVGQAKTPYGVFESTGRWKLPALRRGMIHDIVTDRYGFGGRRLGAKTRMKWKGESLSSALELGVYTEDVADQAPDAAARLTLQPKFAKGLKIQASTYARADARIDEKHGYVGAFGFLYSIKRAHSALGLPF